MYSEVHHTVILTLVWPCLDVHMPIIYTTTTMLYRSFYVNSNYNVFFFGWGGVGWGGVLVRCKNITLIN